MPSEDSARATGTGRPAALLAVRISPADVGRRVTVRHRYDVATLTDVVGRLLTWDTRSGLLRVERRDGSVSEVPYADVVAAKVVPPEVSAEAMQAVAERGWPPLETASLGDWVLRWSDGVTGRANSVRVTGSPGVPLDQALVRVAEWYGERGGPALLQTPAPTAYDDSLAAAGWSVARRTVLRSGPTDALLERATRSWAADPVRVVRMSEPSQEFLDLVDPGLDGRILARILSGPAERVFVEVRDAEGRLLGTGRASATTSASGRWAGITSIATVPWARRRGIATLVLAELARWSLEHDCPRTYLQALASGEAAARLYDGLGLPVHHAYVYRSPTPDAVSPL